MMLKPDRRTNLLHLMCLLWVVLLIAGSPLAAQTRHHQGDLILTGTQKMVLENETLYVQGNIILRDSARLTIRNARLTIDQTYHEEYNIKLRDHASLWVENSTLDASFDMSLIELWKQSQLYIRDSVVEHDVILLDSSQAEIRGGKLRGLWAEEDGYGFNSSWGTAKAVCENVFIHEISFGISRYCKATVRGLRPGRGVDFVLNQTNVEAGDIPYEVALQNCTIEYCDFVVGKHAEVHFVDSGLFQLACHDSGKVTVSDSNVNQVVLRFENLSASFGDLRTGFFVDWTLTSTSGWLPCSLRFQNSTITEGWYLRLRGGDYRIFDSTIVRLRDEFPSLPVAWGPQLLVATSSESKDLNPKRDITALYAFRNEEFLWLRMEFRGKQVYTTNGKSRYEFYLLSPDWGEIRFKLVADRGTLEKCTSNWQLVETYTVGWRVEDAVEVAIPITYLPPFSVIEIIGQSRIFPDQVVDVIRGAYSP